MSELPKIVLQRLANPGGGEHPTPDLLAAFFERQLGQAEREKLLAHLAACGECREVLWHAVPAAETQPAVVSVAGHVWWRIPGWRWAGAAAAVLVIASVGFFYRGGPGAAGMVGGGSGAVAEKSAPSSATAVRTPAPLPSPGAAADLRASNSPKDSNARQGSAAKLAPETDQAQAVARSSSSATLSGASGAAPASTAKISGPAPASTANAGVMIASGIMAPAMGKKKLAPPTRWMLSPAGALLRSTDAGQSWQAVPFVGDVVFQTVAVVGPRVWAGGKGGALYYSPDGGSQWTRLGPAAPAPLNQDIRALIFTDGQHGSLTTADGQTWATSDSGRSWQKQ
ncbi:MAG TPA: YCF48-related protein [Terriglobales bacterium]|nr:YCF48-related protein [Terriglobales bacterium]